MKSPPPPSSPVISTIPPSRKQGTRGKPYSFLSKRNMLDITPNSSNDEPRWPPQIYDVIFGVATLLTSCPASTNENSISFLLTLPTGLTLEGKVSVIEQSITITTRILPTTQEES